MKLEVTEPSPDIHQHSLKLEQFSCTDSDPEMEEMNDEMLLCFCNLCCEFFDNMQLLEAHKKQIHYKPKSNNYTYDKEQNTYNCNGCSQKYSRIAEVLLHYCSFSHNDDQIDPKNEFDGRNQNVAGCGISPDGKKSYQCNLCEKRFPGKSHLIRHSRSHTGEKPYKCDLCDKRFTGSTNLIIHNRTHTGERPYRCNSCKKRFTNKTYLTIHKRIHTGEKPYKCDLCNKRFTTSTHLNIHNRSHTGEKRFKCNACDKRFTQKCHLIRHSRSHTEEKS